MSPERNEKVINSEWRSAGHRVTWCELFQIAAPPNRGNFRLPAVAASADGGKAPMTMFVLAALTVTAFIWAIAEPQTLQDLTADEISQLVVLGFVP
jgi:hypothetical protein